MEVQGDFVEMRPSLMKVSWVVLDDRFVDIAESEDTHDVADDETNDPEYNFLAEAEEEEPDKEDFRNDKATKVTSKVYEV